jgi:hypothetical protein
MSEVRTVRKGNTRHFYRGGREVVRYRIRPDTVCQGEREAVVYSPQAKMLGIPVGVCLGARELKQDEESVRTFLECFLPKSLAKTVVACARKDLLGGGGE